MPKTVHAGYPPSGPHRFVARARACGAADVVLLIVVAAGRAPRVARALALPPDEREVLLQEAADWHGLRLEVDQDVSDEDDLVPLSARRGAKPSSKSVPQPAQPAAAQLPYESEVEMQRAVAQLARPGRVEHDAAAALAGWRCMVTPRTESRKHQVKTFFSRNGKRFRSLLEIERHLHRTTASPSPPPIPFASPSPTSTKFKYYKGLKLKSKSHFYGRAAADEVLANRLSALLRPRMEWV